MQIFSKIQKKKGCQKGSYDMKLLRKSTDQCIRNGNTNTADGGGHS